MRQITVDGRPEAKDVKLLGLRFSNAYRFDLHTDSIREGFKKKKKKKCGIFRTFQNPPTPLAKCGKKNKNNMV